MKFRSFFFLMASLLETDVLPRNSSPPSDLEAMMVRLFKESEEQQKFDRDKDFEKFKSKLFSSNS